MNKDLMAFIRFSKVAGFTFLLALVIGIAGITHVVQRVQANYEMDEVQLTESQQTALDEALSEFIGEEVRNAPLVEHSSGQQLVDMDTVQGFHRFFIEQDDSGYQITDAYRH